MDKSVSLLSGHTVSEPPELNQNNASVWDSRAHALKALGRKEEANEAYDKGVWFECPEYENRDTYIFFNR